MTKKQNKHIGSSFDDFLDEEGIYHEVHEGAIKKYFAAIILNKMKADNISKTKMAELMNTSRSAVDRLLDPNYKGVTLNTLEAAAKAVGKKLRVELV